MFSALIPRRGSSNSNKQTQPSSIADSNSINDTTLEPRSPRIVLSSIDSCHSMTGIILKLKGYYSFLKQFSEYRDKVVLIQIIRGLFFKSDNIEDLHAEDGQEASQNS